ncbi:MULTISPECIES: hypothetical protein [Streptomyces]|uniref:WXG100 family type VII secretion target n=1 Tax=Streptomyces rubrogriseus TaxID=194673 RepID=A0ABT4NUZ7_9ACTN|nr:MULTISPECIES: hypothetical protein [Streptomyces anthocyanicus group]MCW8121117.1 hypothetical protein [Streptomyces anthocyanicus]MCZ4632947.1 hypothetical protein [Streptomyces rubrogriseus]
MSSSLAAMSESRLNAGMAFAGKWHEDASKFAGQIVDLLRAEADAAEAEFRRFRGLV